MITPSVTAAASTWDSMFALGSQTLDKAVTVKLTRTLAIIPITLALAFWRAKKEKSSEGAKVSMKSIFPFFILYFVGASVITTVFQSMISAEIITGAASTVILGFFSLMKQVSKFFIVMAMAAIGLNTDIVKLVRSGGKPIFMGLCCWIGISLYESRNAARHGYLVNQNGYIFSQYDTGTRNRHFFCRLRAPVLCHLFPDCGIYISPEIAQRSLEMLMRLPVLEKSSGFFIGFIRRRSSVGMLKRNDRLSRSSFLRMT